MKLALTLMLLWLFSAAAAAEVALDSDADPATEPWVERLQRLQQMRLRLEQDMAEYFGQARAGAASGGSPQAPAGGTEVRQMRQDMAASLERLEDRFRCLDVDLNGNNGNVVLVCGDNHGPVSTNNQQAFGADLNVSGGAR